MKLEREWRLGRVIVRRRDGGAWHLTVPWNRICWSGLYVDTPWLSVTVYPL